MPVNFTYVPRLSTLMGISDKELEDGLDQLSPTAFVAGPQWWYDEYNRRLQARETAAVRDATTTLKQLTWLIALLTLANVVATIVLVVN